MYACSNSEMWCAAALTRGEGWSDRRSRLGRVCGHGVGCWLLSPLAPVPQLLSIAHGTLSIAIAIAIGILLGHTWGGISN